MNAVHATVTTKVEPPVPTKALLKEVTITMGAEAARALDTLLGRLSYHDEVYELPSALGNLSLNLAAAMKDCA